MTSPKAPGTTAEAEREELRGWCEYRAANSKDARTTLALLDERDALQAERDAARTALARVRDFLPKPDEPADEVVWTLTAMSMHSIAATFLATLSPVDGAAGTKETL